MKEFSLNISQNLQIELTHFISFAINFLSYKFLKLVSNFKNASKCILFQMLVEE